MTELGKNESLLKILSDKNSLLDSNLYRILISRETSGELIVEMDFTLMYSQKYSNIKLIFNGIIEYGFYQSNKNNFYDVASYKFFIVADKHIYLSLDPVDETDKPSSEDQDFVLSKEVTGYKID